MVIPVSKAAKRPYRPPSFQVIDAVTAKAELEAKGAPQDPQVRQMLAQIDKQLDEKALTLPSPSRDPLP
ncbi:MAG TPA: hypothetical protein VEU94_06155 [Terriglobales bacterium]|nr:hypothetical protein [Terriglobales bacterium]